MRAILAWISQRAGVVLVQVGLIMQGLGEPRMGRFRQMISEPATDNKTGKFLDKRSVEYEGALPAFKSIPEGLWLDQR